MPSTRTLLFAAALLCPAFAPLPGQSLPDAPSSLLMASAPEPAAALHLDGEPDFSSSTNGIFDAVMTQQSGQTPRDTDKKKPGADVPVDAEGKPIPLDRQQPTRLLGFMPNFRSVSAGAKPHPPGWKYNFKVATHQAFDYSSFIFLGITSLSAEGINSHPVLGKGVGGAWAYTWRGFLDKTDGTYLGAWLLPSLLHQDTRYYAVGKTHGVPYRILYIISRQGVARTYGGHQTPNIAGLGGKVLTQVISRQYYPTGATSFGVLATKFGYSAMRDVAFTSIREFYPDIAAHFIRKHREKVARLSAQDATAAAAGKP